MQKNLFLFAGLVTLLAIGAQGCGKPTSNPPPVQKSVAIEYSTDFGAPPCQCYNAQSVSIRNPDGQSRFANVEIEVRDRATDNFISKGVKPFVIPAGQKSFAGCTNGEYPSCLVKSTYRVVSEGRLKSSTTAVTKSFGPFYAADINTCFAICNDDENDNSCLRLGKEALPVTAPLAVLAKKAAAGDATITPDEIAKEFGTTNPVDKCSRGPVTVKDGVATNESTDPAGCTYSTLDAIKPLGESVYMTGFVPRKFVASIQPSDLLRVQGEQQNLRFDDFANAPILNFVGDGADAVNAIYGGTIVSMSVVGETSYYATANGCLSSPVK